MRPRHAVSLASTLVTPRLLWRAVPACCALAIASLAWIQPVSTTDADAGLALVAAQALVQHGTLDLAIYRPPEAAGPEAAGGPRLTYDLDTDYRIEHGAGGERIYFSRGLPMVAAPWVWLANRLGADMLRPAEEETWQNLLSALACGAVFLLLYRLGCCFLRPLPSLLLALVFQLGSPLISTLATALWNLDASVPLMLWALIALVRFEHGERDMPWLVVPGALGLAILCRPAAAFLGLGVVLYALSRWGFGRWALLLFALLTTIGLVLLDHAPMMLAPQYYAPQRLIGNTPLVEGLPSILLSPSRGLLVFCPFLLPLAWEAWRQRAWLCRQRLGLLAAVWCTGQLLSVATKGRWWGGYSFGPRLLTELMLPAFLIAALLLARGVRDARAWLIAGALLALPALAIHSGQGLWDPATWRWNQQPDIDATPERLFSWADAQFLTTSARLEARKGVWHLRNLTPLDAGVVLGPQHPAGWFDGWWPAETSWRWSKTAKPRLCFRPRGIAPGRWYVLRLELAAKGVQRLTLRDGEQVLARSRLEGFTARTLRVPVAGARLLKPGLVCLTLLPSQPRPAGPGDPRSVAIAFRSLSFEAVPEAAEITARAQTAFLAGWSQAEDAWRWSVGHHARLFLAVRELRPDMPHELVFEGFGNGTQSVTVRLAGGPALAHWSVTARRASYRAPLPPGSLRAGALTLVFDLPDAKMPANGDRRALGIALQRLRVVPVARARRAGARAAGG